MDLIPAHPGDALILEDGAIPWCTLREARTPSRAGERVAIHEPNSPVLVSRLFSLLRTGAVPVLAHPRWPQAMAARALQAVQSAPVNEGTILFTSGSTGEPKAIVHDTAAHLASARASATRIPFGPGDRWLLSLPLCHVGGLSLLFRAANAGGALAIPNPTTSLTAALTRLQPSHVSLVPTQLRRLLDDDDGRRALATTRAVLIGGAPCPASLLQRALGANIPVHQTYGCTEMASQICTSLAGAPSTCGPPLPGQEVRLDDDEILVRGPTLMRGHLRDGTLTPAPAWHRTGDLGRWQDGGLVVVGRIDNLFICGGENVQPESIEAVFAEAGHEVIVVPVDDDEFGARPVAFTRAVTQDLEAIAQEHLPNFQRPIAWHPMDDDDGLKPRRSALRLRAQLLADRS